MITGNEPAMPQLTYNRKTGKADGFELGLTKREYFAARAMQGMLHVPPVNLERVAELSVKAADAIIAELNKQP